LNNNGQSRYEGYRISWEGEWQNHSLGINATYEKTQVSHESYDDLLNDEDLEDQVWFDGHLVKITELPRSDFNRPWVINFVYVGKFPYGFTFSGVAKYRSGYRALKDSGEDMVLSDGESVPIYEKVKKGGSVIVSCQVNWEKQLWLNHSLVLSLEVQNLLNKKTPVAATDDYEIGRQFWAGLEYRF
jgi:outer membrane receptor protein involved in Fe transport